MDKVKLEQVVRTHATATGGRPRALSAVSTAELLRLSGGTTTGTFQRAYGYHAIPGVDPRSRECFSHREVMWNLDTTKKVLTFIGWDEDGDNEE